MADDIKDIKIQLKDDSGNRVYPKSSVERFGGGISGNLDISGNLTVSSGKEFNADFGNIKDVDDGTTLKNFIEGLNTHNID